MANIENKEREPVSDELVLVRAAKAGDIKAFNYPKMVTPWEVKKAELGGVMGNESLIAEPWKRLESMAYVWLWQWVL